MIAAKASPGPPRRKRKEEQRATQIEAAMQSLKLSKWPEIPLAHISKVTKEMLARLVRIQIFIFSVIYTRCCCCCCDLPVFFFLFPQSNIDEGGNFAIPVVEAFPEISDDYLAKISNPMDFRTIEEDRLQLYHSIADLQEDLILVFSNCMNYNVPDSDLYVIAQYVFATFAAACSTAYEGFCS